MNEIITEKFVHVETDIELNRIGTYMPKNRIPE